jgi:hypothetical protein
MYLHCIHISNKEAFDDSSGYISTLSVLQPFMCSYRYAGFWIPLTFVWSEYITCGTREYILTLFLLLAGWTDSRIWIAYVVPASCTAAINSTVYLKQEWKILSLLRYIALLAEHVFHDFPYLGTGLNNWTAHLSTLTWLCKMESDEWRKQFECIC